MSAPLVFIIPVRHQKSISDWQAIKGYIAQTLASISAQTVPDWECVIVANEGTDLPTLPSKCRAMYVSLPLPNLPNRTDNLTAYYDTIREDKGQRIYYGMQEVSHDSHIMVVDFDDFVSCRLAELVINNQAVPGWNIEDGYVWSGGKWCYLQDNFHEVCGTSHIIRRDLYGVLEQDGLLDIEAIKRRLGSHKFIHHDLAIEGHQLEVLPFPGAVYRIGNSQSTSGAGALFSTLTPMRDFIWHPIKTGRRLWRYQRMQEEVYNEFTIPKPNN